MNGVGVLDFVEVIIILDRDIRVIESASHSSLGDLIVPWGTVPACRIISRSNKVISVAGVLQLVEAFKLHSLNDGVSKLFSGGN